MSIFRPEIDKIAEIPVSALAYLGDAVFELHVRLHYLQPPQNPKEYHQLVVNRVRAESQAQFLSCLDLTPAESELVRRGRNAAGSASRKLDPNIYQKATGFEVLIGYLYLTDPERLEQILTQLVQPNPSNSAL
ncbi:ribonuclease III domain-containing protein [Tumidithrix elongata RA019]|uniref:Mini-ribonuclease 3 n=1 Tax=Tumidithrix elongata BACA0141 TaxID=2716417 RepID=A0AAW9PWL5_9CYAN|nr:ribonuclease III domain-containing protein [Tumidithrix elongata RA019]